MFWFITRREAHEVDRYDLVTVHRGMGDEIRHSWDGLGLNGDRLMKVWF